jgi:hypothetical protein
MSESKVSSRRALLVGAGGAAAALAANAALPASRVLAVDQPLLLNVTNAAADAVATQLTGNMADPPGVFGVDNAAMSGTAIAGHGVALSTGVRGATGDLAGLPDDMSYTGVFGYAEAGDGVTTFGAGVWGDSGDFGVYGTGSTGVYGDGGSAGTGLEGYSQTGYGLYVTGKVKLASRSGRVTVLKGKTSYAKALSGVAASNLVIAVLQTNQSGTWVRAAVASTNKFTVYFNRALTANAVLAWVVLN